MATAYDENDPWHSNANLIFGFGCQNCAAWIDMEWPDEGGDPAFLKACVDVSERVQAAGWVCTEPFRFLCPRCAAARKAG